MAPCDLILKNGKFWTAEPANPWAEAVAISGSQLTAVGKISDMPSSATQVIDLGGRSVLPGLWDAHMHFYYWSLGLQQVPLANVASLEEMLEKVAEHMEKLPAGAWSSGWGWNDSTWECPPSRHHLDRVTGLDRPALFWRSDMHSAVANTAALMLAGLLEPGAAVEGGIIERDQAGEPTGLLRELAINPVRDHLPAPTGEHSDTAMLEGIRQLHASGVIGICDQRMKDQEDGPKSLAALARLNRRGQLKLRVNCNIAAHNLSLLETLGLASPIGDERLKLGHVKIFADGTLGSKTAWMLEPFLGAKDEHGNLGMALTPPEQILEEMQRAHDIGFPVSIHAIGDRANRECLDLFEKLAETQVELPVMPHRIEHVQTIVKSDVPRLAHLGLCASVQPAHILDDMDVADHFLGERARRCYRFKDIRRANVLLALGSDAPVADHNPFLGIHAAVFRQRPARMERGPWYPDQCLTLEEALIGYTIGAARALGWEKITGSLRIRKKADLIVLDRDLFKLVEKGVLGDELSSTKVLMTVFDGKIVHDELPR